MRSRILVSTLMVLVSFILSACGSSISPTAPAAVSASPVEATDPALMSTPTRPEWFDFEMTDVLTGDTFTINDFAGKVVLLQTMAEWCPNCIVQQNEVRDLHEALGNPDDLVSISLDVDLNEDAASLKEYAEEWGYDWRFAVASLDITRALGNLYSAQYLNVPIEPMLLVDRDGNAYSLPYGKKDAERLQEIVEPYLKQ